MPCGLFEKANRCGARDVDHWVEATAVLKAQAVGAQTHSSHQPSAAEGDTLNLCYKTPKNSTATR
jgi:hypothetical protein